MLEEHYYGFRDAYNSVLVRTSMPGVCIYRVPMQALRCGRCMKRSCSSPAVPSSTLSNICRLDFLLDTMLTEDL